MLIKQKWCQSRIYELFSDTDTIMKRSTIRNHLRWSKKVSFYLWARQTRRADHLMVEHTQRLWTSRFGDFNTPTCLDDTRISYTLLTPWMIHVIPIPVWIHSDPCLTNYPEYSSTQINWGAVSWYCYYIFHDKTVRPDGISFPNSPWTSLIAPKVELSFWRD